MLHISLVDDEIPPLSVETEDGLTLRFEFHPRLTRDEMSSIMVRNGVGKDSVEVPSFQRIARKCIKKVEGVQVTTKEGKEYGPVIEKASVMAMIFNDTRLPQDVVNAVVSHVLDANQLGDDEGNS
jgi:hypothetical protein